MWKQVSLLDGLNVEGMVAVWISPDGGELLILTAEKTVYWSLVEGRELWSILEKAGGDGLSPDGRLYRDIPSGLFYRVMGRNGGTQCREHPDSGRITVSGAQQTVTVTSPDGSTQSIPYDGSEADWLVASFCESGARVLIAGPDHLAVYARQ